MMQLYTTGTKTCLHMLYRNYFVGKVLHSQIIVKTHSITEIFVNVSTNKYYNIYKYYNK